MINSNKRTNLGIDTASLLLRLTFGFLMLFNHGWGKFMRFFEDGPVKFGDPLGIGTELSLGLAVFAEVFCAGLLVLGLFTRLATIPLIITMAVAAFIVHINDPLSRMESALLYLTVYIVILLLGPGKFSLDRMIKKG